MRLALLLVCLIFFARVAQRAAGAESPPPVVLCGEKVMVEAESRDGGLRERYLANRDGAWVEVATAAPGGPMGPVSAIAAGGVSLPGTLRRVSLSGGALVEELAAGEHRIIRQLKIVDNGPWIRVVTRLEPSGRASLHQLADHLKFSHRADWSFSPSVGGFNPDAQYKAPLVLVQADRVALGIVPDLAMLRREQLKRCNHALDLDVPGGPVLGVGFMPARLASHSVYYRTTGKVEYLERGIAALRSQFPISPSENWAHVGYGGKAGVSSFHWGTGSGMAGIEIEEDYLHDAIVDVAAGRGIGVNGLNVGPCSVAGGQIRLGLSSPFAWSQPPVVVFRRTEPSRRYQVFVNGAEAGAWSGADLEKGVRLSPAKAKP